MKDGDTCDGGDWFCWWSEGWKRTTNKFQVRLTWHKQCGGRKLFSFLVKCGGAREGARCTHRYVVWVPTITRAVTWYHPSYPLLFIYFIPPTFFPPRCHDPEKPVLTSAWSDLVSTAGGGGGRAAVGWHASSERWPWLVKDRVDGWEKWKKAFSADFHAILRVRRWMGWSLSSCAPQALGGVVCWRATSGRISDQPACSPSLSLPHTPLYPGSPPSW